MEQKMAEEEDYPDMEDSQWLTLLSTLRIAADAPCVDRHFWCKATRTDWGDHIIMQTWDNQQWVHKFHMKKGTFLEFCERLALTFQHKDTHPRAPMQT